MTNSNSDKRRGAAANREKAMERSRTVLRRLDEGATHAELAVELGVGVDSVRTIAQRARARLGVPGPRSVVRVGQLPAGPMADRRTKRNRSRAAQNQTALFDQES